MKFSIQLYTLRDLVKAPADFLALFPKIKALGFDGVELGGDCQGLDAAVTRRALEDAGLAATGTHMNLNDLRPKNLQKTIDYCKHMGLSMIGIGGADHRTPRRAAKSCAILKAASDAAALQGITIYYHNHESEFKPYRDGTLPIDRFKAACALQVDTYWSFCAQIDNYTFITENKDRICSLHIKDGVGKDTRALGEGNCGLAAVVRGAKAIGLEWLVLENDSPKPDGLSDAARSMAWLKANVSTEERTSP